MSIINLNNQTILPIFERKVELSKELSTSIDIINKTKGVYARKDFVHQEILNNKNDISIQKVNYTNKKTFYCDYKSLHRGRETLNWGDETYSNKPFMSDRLRVGVEDSKLFISGSLSKASEFKSNSNELFEKFSLQSDLFKYQIHINEWSCNFDAISKNNPEKRGIIYEKKEVSGNKNFFSEEDINKTKDDIVNRKRSYHCSIIIDCKDEQEATNLGHFLIEIANQIPVKYCEYVVEDNNIIRIAPNQINTVTSSDKEDVVYTPAVIMYLELAKESYNKNSFLTQNIIDKVMFKTLKDLWL